MRHCIQKLNTLKLRFNFIQAQVSSIKNSALYPTDAKKTKISEGYLVRENVKFLSNSVTKFCDQGICEEFHFFRH